MMQKSILLLGCGYVGKFLGRRLLKEGWQVFATTRDESIRDSLKNEGFSPILFSSSLPVKNITHVLSSIAPREGVDPGLSFLGRQEGSFSWVGYLSSTSVYGDHQGEWVDETSETRGKTEKGIERLKAEEAWSRFSQRQGCPLLIYRLSGIYGPHRNIFQNMKEGKEFETRYFKDQFISRIHIQDICDFLVKTFSRSSKSSLFNVADDEPSSIEEVKSYAYFLKREALPLTDERKIPFTFPSFLKENRRVSNKKMKEFLGTSLKFPSYKEGLKDIFEKGLF